MSACFSCYVLLFVSLLLALPFGQRRESCVECFVLRMGGCRTTTAAGTTTLSNERPRVAVCCVVSRLGSFLVFESSRVRRDGERER